MGTSLLIFTGFLVIAIVLGLLLVSLPKVLAPRHRTKKKMQAYECGEPPIGNPWVRFRAGYYIVALAFVLFDVESVFLYPWAMAIKKLGAFGFVQMAVFIGILLLGLVYAWRKGALEWV
ncbi:MAG: NADH-quinone oxidoreductase subunit A [Coriobacteriia bacterium]|nr:NADH-quinone oxidoreductase subunit A [Coriobacteriia bacterium]